MIQKLQTKYGPILILITSLLLALAFSLPANAAVDMFIKIEGTAGESTDENHAQWTKLKVKGNKAYLKDRKGRVKQAQQGTFSLSDGRIVTIKNGIVVSVTKTGAAPTRKSVKPVRKNTLTNIKLPEGFYMKNNKLHARKGYTFRKISPNRVAMQRIGDAASDTKVVSCGCSSSGGTCTTIFTPQLIYCAPVSCAGTCSFLPPSIAPGGGPIIQ